MTISRRKPVLILRDDYDAAGNHCIVLLAPQKETFDFGMGEGDALWTSRDNDFELISPRVARVQLRPGYNAMRSQNGCGDF